MSEVIGEGSYGCVHRPSLKCKKKKIDYENKISKILTKKHLNDEMKEYKQIKKIDKRNEIHLGTPTTCVPSKVNKSDIDKCDNFISDEIDNYGLMILPDGGKDLEYFASSCRNLKNTRSNTKMIHKFWIECHRLLYGIYLMQKKGYIHHDLKAQNIVYNDKENRINFIDFGLMIDKASVVKELNESKYSLATPFWYFPFEFMFLNKKTFLNASLINEKTAISKEKLFEKLEKNPQFAKYRKMFYDNTVNTDKFITKNDDDFYSMFLSIKESEYDNFIEKSLNTIDIYGTGMGLLYVLRRSSHLINKDFFKELYNLFLNMITASLDKRLTIDIALSKYEELLEKYKILDKTLTFKDHKLQTSKKSNTVTNITKKIKISKEEKKKLLKPPVYNKTKKGGFNNTIRSPYSL